MASEVLGTNGEAAATALLNKYALPNISVVSVIRLLLTRHMNAVSSSHFLSFSSHVFIGGIPTKTCQHSSSKDGGIERRHRGSVSC